jgi:hypothetical protein
MYQDLRGNGYPPCHSGGTARGLYSLCYGYKIWINDPAREIPGNRDAIWIRARHHITEAHVPCIGVACNIGC